MTGLNSNSRRILIVDDNRAIHADFRKILCPDRSCRKELEEYTRDVEENEHRIRTILNAMPQPVLVTDDDVRILDYNAAAGALPRPTANK
jgi:PAS domain-containing protein